jgi:uncharacterized membrane protein YfcA
MEWIAVYFAIGVVAGTLAGMLGVGGGGLIVPMMVAVFAAQEFPRAEILHLAVGTSMASIIFTSIASSRAHAKRGVLRWDIVRGMTPGIIVGGLCGSLFAGSLPNRELALAFALVFFVAGALTVLDRQPAPSRGLPGWLGLAVGGFIISGVSSFAAIGGAFMTIPFLLWCGVPMLQVIGTSSAVGLPIAITGSVGFMITGFSATGLPAGSVGYVYLPALGAMLVGSFLMAPIGAATAHRLPVKTLKRILGVLLFLFALSMLWKFWH